MIKWNEYTWYSRLAAVIFFIAILPAWTFYLGTEYEATQEVLRQNVPDLPGTYLSLIERKMMRDSRLHVDAATYLPGKVFYSDSASGEWGTFNADHTITMGWGLDAVQNDTRPHGGTGTWKVKGNTLFIIPPFSTIADEYDFDTLQKYKVGGEVIVGRWNYYEDDEHDHPAEAHGFFIADSNKTISNISNVFDTPGWHMQGFK